MMATHGKNAETEVALTTIMLTRLRGTCKMFDIMKLIDSIIPPRRYDMIYLPRFNRSRKNIGLAFINFPTNTLAAQCLESLHEASLSSKTVGKYRAGWAHIQGLGQNLALFAVKNGIAAFSYPDAPLVLVSGRRYPTLTAFNMLVSPKMIEATRIARSFDSRDLDVKSVAATNTEKVLEHVQENRSGSSGTCNFGRQYFDKEGLQASRLEQGKETKNESLQSPSSNVQGDLNILSLHIFEF